MPLDRLAEEEQYTQRSGSPSGRWCSSLDRRGIKNIKPGYPKISDVASDNREVVMERSYG